ncbi:30S ribosomal protein S2 [Patescibacteria group bacterium]|nr:30S ribosomal protein S2 [Patescibacteria group bacterium]MBU1967010.1 30S ribosomal protein S2 [Patescibacteria group bacterium]MBU2542993.1 30S ribosomal protein S2 [Patescibacteria group bacterium]
MIDVSQLENVAPEYDLRDLLEAGCHFGHEASKWHPSMAQWIYTQQNGIHIFDLEKTAAQLTIAYNYLYQLGKEGKTIIFVGTKRQAREIVKEKIQESGIHWITSRWLGGLFTNWQQVSKSLKKMIEIEEGLKGDKYKMYTKYEQTQLEKEAGRCARFFDGLRELKDIPDALFVIDPSKEKIALTEAETIGVPVVAIVDTNTNPRSVEVVIPANDDGRGSIEFIVDQLIEAYTKGKAAKTGSKNKADETADKTNMAGKAAKPAKADKKG